MPVLDIQKQFDDVRADKVVIKDGKFPKHFLDAERKLVLQLELADPRKALAARDIPLCHIEALQAEKIEAAAAITAACLASKEADAKRDEAI